jgi:mannose-6-phosphate isomerase-like protein (cupin superfamily)
VFFVIDANADSADGKEEMDSLSKEVLKAINPEPPRPPKPRKELGHLNHWTPAILLERAAYLHKLARHSDGSASETLKEYPQHSTMLSFRSRDGQAELHDNFADIFYVLEGRATLVTGGTVVGAAAIAPGEVRGVAIEGGARQELRAGDVAHVPAGVPHQFLVPGEKTVTCFVIKIQETA